MPNNGGAPEIDMAQFDDLNRFFYGSAPHEYIRHRMRQVALFLAEPGLVRDALTRGVEVGSLRVRQVDSEKEDPGRDTSLAALDAEILLHHASETLLRLYLAHRGMPACPWLEMSKLRNFSSFKEQVREAFGPVEPDARRVEEVRQVFIDAPKEAIEGMTDAVWADAPLNIYAFLHGFSQKMLEGAPLYNAAKHGLGLRAGDAAFKIGRGEHNLAMSGPAIQHLELVEREDGRFWAQAVEWISVDRNLAFVEVAVRLIEQLWSAAKSRYCDEDRDHISVLSEPDYGHLAQPVSGFLERMRMDLSYLEPGGTSRPRRLDLKGVLRP